MDSIITAATSYPPASLNRWTEKFERQAELTPAQTAVISGNRELSYRELSESSDRIADRLRGRGVGRGQVVGLGLHRSLDLPAAVLGIMKSGAAYLPLDPGFPAARIAQMIHSAKLQHVLTHRGLAAQFPNVDPLCVDEKSPAAVTGDSDSSENLRHWYSISLTLGTHDRTLIISSPSFELTRRNFFGPLASGGTLILDDCQTPDIARIAALIGHHRVSLIQCTPDAFYPLVDATAQDGYRALHSLRFAVLGEVPVSVTRLRAWLEHPQCRAEVVNLYGPSGCTEISGFQCLHRGNLSAPKSGSPRRAAIQLRGTFHNHTTASDGHDTLEAMADEAMDLGLQYLGIADHSKASFQANGLDESRLLAQIEAIAKLNAGYENFRLFAGSEVDILKDGTLDFDDALLAKLDYVVASVHASFTLSEEEMTRRLCRAMENEHVTMLGHVTGRLLLKREPYSVNHAMVIDCAAATRTIIELNCSPQRLDMDWRWWKRARDKGVLCSINPDAHSTLALHHLGLGVRLARKGWLTKQDVFNTRSIAEVTGFLETPKAKR